ncbi:MAG: hypothetical protein HWN67_01550 [Candidatus Helarchaeota archaeon]|nr:hypothetical protein [Candidatus Helarchaeota archaeon]
MEEIELKYLKDAISKLPEAFSPESSPALAPDNLMAVSFDFLNYELEIPANLKNFKKVLSRIPKNQRAIYIIEIGILSNVDVLPIFKAAIKRRSKDDFNVIFLISEIAKSLADIVPPENFINDPERGEEVVRKLAKAFGIKIAGESEAESKSRLLQVDSLELKNVKDQIEAKIRKALEEARRKAKAAAKVTRE